jgi:hypothetical protein
MITDSTIALSVKRITYAKKPQKPDLLLREKLPNIYDIIANIGQLKVYCLDSLKN